MNETISVVKSNISNNTVGKKKSEILEKAINN
jgi:hypothetical protein